MGGSWIQKHDAEAPGVSVPSPAMVVGLGTYDDVTPGITEQKNADVLLIRRRGILTVGIHLAVESAQGTSRRNTTP